MADLIREPPGQIADMALRSVIVAINPESTLWQGIARGAVQRLRGDPEMRVILLRRPYTPDDGADGLIIRANSSALRRAAVASGKPAVNVSHQLPDADDGLPRVGVDESSVAREAIEHLRGQGLRRVAYIGDRSGYGLTRGAAFAEHARRLGLELVGVDYGEERVALLQRIAASDLPTGILVSNDDRAEWVLNALDQRSVSVPQRVAVVGVDDDALTSLRLPIALSSVAQPGQAIGWHAAELLLRMMDGGSPPDIPLCLPSDGVRVRASSDLLRIDDPGVRQALAFIQAHQGRDPGVDAVARACGMHRRTLELRFRHATGTSIHQEIRRLQIERARELLRMTRLPLGEVARLAGFEHRQTFATAMRQAFGCSASDYRRQHAG